MENLSVALPKILLKCTDEKLCITTMSSFYKPKLNLKQMDLNDCLLLLNSWITEKKYIVFRWMSDIDNTVAEVPFDFTDYSKPENCDGTQFVLKTGFPLYHCDKVAKVAAERDRHILGNNCGTRLSPRARRSLSYPTMIPNLSASIAEDVGIPRTDVTFCDLSQSTIQPSKRTYEELDKENLELQEKIIKLEAYVDKLAKDCADQEDKKADVEEELEKLKREQPVALIEKMKEHVLDLGQILKNSYQTSTSAHSPSVSYLSSPTSLGGSPVPVFRAVAPHSVILFKEVLINEGSLRKAKVALKTDGNSKKSRNNGVSIILDALYQPEELANMSLSGNSCPSIPGSKPKPPIPKEVLEEIIGFMIRFWDQAYKGYILTEQQVKESVSAKLMAVHTKGRKTLKKMLLANDASVSNDAATSHAATVPTATIALLASTTADF